MSLLFNMLSRFVIAFLPRKNEILISWLQSSFTVILEPKKIKSVTVSIVSPSVCHEVMGPDAMILVFWNPLEKSLLFPADAREYQARCQTLSEPWTKCFVLDTTYTIKVVTTTAWQPCDSPSVGCPILKEHLSMSCLSHPAMAFQPAPLVCEFWGISSYLSTV